MISFLIDMRTRVWVLTGGVALCLSSGALMGQDSARELTLDAYLGEVLDANDRIQIAVIQTEIGLRKRACEDQSQFE